MTPKQLAKKRCPRAVWITGKGAYASVAYCPRGITVELHDTLADAERAKHMIDHIGCGGLCVGDHEVITLSE
jgi:hypothetical protein